MSVTAEAAPATVSGTVVDAAGRPLVGAHVRWQGHDDEALEITDSAGAFTLFLDGPPDYQGMYFIGVAMPGYFNLMGGVDEGGDYKIPLEFIEAFDNPDYLWVPPQPQSVYSPITQNLGCGACHGDYYDAWKNSRHAAATTDPFVLDLYTGSGAEGAVEQRGSGYRLDYPDDPGPCADCHAATAALAAPSATDLTKVSGVHENGVYCETCHKVRDVGDPKKTPVTGAFRYWRPQSGVLMAFGPLDDAAEEHHMGPMSFNPEMSQARFCSGCHEWENANGLGVMETYSEWAASSYRELDIKCQDCHMRPLDHEEKVQPLPPSDYVEGDLLCILRSPAEWREPADATCDVMGASLRPESRLHPHGFEGTSDEFLIAAASLELTAKKLGDRIEAEVKVENTSAGHMLPTGMPFRNMVLFVRAFDDAGNELEFTKGSVLPDWATMPADDVPAAGTPGKGFARRLADDSGDDSVPFWRATQVLSDTRVPPMGVDTSYYRFQAPASGAATVRATLIYRRFTGDLALEKAWDVEDQIMATREVDATSDGCAAAVPGSLWFLVLVPLFARWRRRLPWLLAAVMLQACDGSNGGIPNASLAAQAVAPLPNGAACPADVACLSGVCTPACNGEHVCTPASCSDDATCGSGFCCVDGACAFAPGGTCGARDTASGGSCVVSGASDCAEGLACAYTCTPAALCTKTCDTADDCGASVDEQTGRLTQVCEPLDAVAAYCIDDPEITARCEIDADCDDGICDWSLARSGDAIALMCNPEPYGPNPIGARCEDLKHGEAEANYCASGICWDGGDYDIVCGGFCRPELGDADCECGDDPDCTPQICVNYPIPLSATDEDLVDTVPLCFNSSRCASDADCADERYCAIFDAWTDVELLCLPKHAGGEEDNTTCGQSAECGSNYCVSSKCTPRRALGAACTSDSQCLERCRGGFCTGPCVGDAECLAASDGNLTSCAAVSISSGDGQSQTVSLCQP